MTLTPPRQFQDDPHFQFALEVVRKLQEADYIAYWAGGCVRDFLRGVPPKDYDIATSALPDQVRKLFGHRQTVAVGAAFGVILVRSGHKAIADVEVATFRTDESYEDGRRPSQVVFSTPEEDAQRRDLTINGLFWDPVEERIHDFVGGRDDLKDKIIRAIGDPVGRFEEDKLRLLRTIRFAAHLKYEIDTITWEALCEHADSIRVVSAERISQEFRRMMVDPHRQRAMQLCQSSGLLREIFPEWAHLFEHGLEKWDRIMETIAELREPNFSLVMAVLLHPIVEDGTTTVEVIGRRLRLSNQEIAHIEWLVSRRPETASPQSRKLSELKRLFHSPHARDLLEWERAEATAFGRSLEDWEFLEDFLLHTSHEEMDPAPLVGGHDLIAAGMKASPRFAEILETIRDAQLNLEISTTAEALELLERLKKMD